MCAESSYSCLFTYLAVVFAQLLTIAFEHYGPHSDDARGFQVLRDVLADVGHHSSDTIPQLGSSHEAPVAPPLPTFSAALGASLPQRRHVRFSDYDGNTVVLVRSRHLNTYDASFKLRPSLMPWHPLDPPNDCVSFMKAPNALNEYQLVTPHVIV